jgi:RNA polymerase sigma-70 factor (ECF subfamily)
MMTRAPAGNTSIVHSATLRVREGLAARIDAASDVDDVRTFTEIYDKYFAFVWRSLRRLGIAEDTLDDAAQDVFLVVHRRLRDFEGRSSVRTWLFGIILRVVRGRRRSETRRRRRDAEGDVETMADLGGGTPHDHSERREAAAALHAILDGMDDDKRAVFVMAELEQMTAPEIAEALEVNVNTVYSRLRAARIGFNEAVARRSHAMPRAAAGGRR